MPIMRKLLKISRGTFYAARLACSACLHLVPAYVWSYVAQKSFKIALSNFRINERVKN